MKTKAVKFWQLPKTFMPNPQPSFLKQSHPWAAISHHFIPSKYDEVCLICLHKSLTAESIPQASHHTVEVIFGFQYLFLWPQFSWIYSILVNIMLEKINFPYYSEVENLQITGPVTLNEILTSKMEPKSQY